MTRVITLTRLDEHDPERPFHVQYTVTGTQVTREYWTGGLS